MKSQKLYVFIFVIFILFSLVCYGQKSQNCPELVIFSITKSPALATTSDDITFTVKVKNIGLAPAPQSDLGIHISGEVNPIIHKVPPLASGAIHTVTRTKKLTVAKNYTVTATADHNNHVNECMENNNTKPLNFNVIQGCSDLVILSITKSPALALTTEPIIFHVKVKNIGLAAAPPSTLGVRVQGEPKTSRHRVPELGRGATTTVNVSRRLNVAKSYRITAEVDYGNKITECIEYNNLKYLDFSVTQGCAELVVLSITKTPPLPTTTDDIVFSVKVKNIGLATAPPSELSMKLKTERQSTKHKVSSLSSGATATIKRTTKISVAGNNRLTATADHNHMVSECMENNNTKFLDFNVKQGCCDLVINSIKMSPENPTTSDTIQFKVEVKNIGLAKAPASTLGIQIGGGPVGKHRVPALSRGATTTIIITRQLSTAKKYRITATADHSQVITECMENNNTRFLRFTVSQ